jgi:hypothetical protein
VNNKFNVFNLQLLIIFGAVGIVNAINISALTNRSSWRDLCHGRGLKNPRSNNILSLASTNNIIYRVELSLTNADI